MFHRLILGVFVVAQVASSSEAGSLAHLDTLSESLRSPARLALADDGTVLVSDTFNDHIARFSADGEFLGTWPVPEGPIGVAVHPDGRYFVSLRDEGKVGVYDEMFAFIGFLGDGDPDVAFVQPTDIDIATDTGQIYVVDGAGDRVYGFAADGSLMLRIGARGGGAGDFRYPSALAVDEARGRLVVADHDNFRVQIFTTGGVFGLRFGYRLKFTPGEPSQGWVARTQGIAVDDAGDIYVADAMMSTVRVFDATGTEIDKLLEYGSEPGDLRTPCDLALSVDGTRLYVVSTNTSSVEVYATPDLGGLRTPAGAPGAPGTNGGLFDSLRVGRNGASSKAMSPSAFEWIYRASARDTTFDGPHMVDDSEIVCGRCHGFPDLPGGQEDAVEGQSLLCMSCHSAGGQALQNPVHESDVALSHPWGVPAVNPAVGSLGPTPGGPLALYLDDGNIKCATCHDQHSTFHEPYLRMTAANAALCKDCHRGIGAPADHGRLFTAYCMDCHDTHSTSGNLHLVRDRFTFFGAADVTFTDDTRGVGPGAFVDPDPLTKGVCEACHAYPAGSGPHTLSSGMPACTDCHRHEAGFEVGSACVNKGDGNGDCHIDLEDYAECAGFLAGPDTPADAAAECYDFDGDLDVDLADLARLQIEYTGPDQAIPGCSL